MPVHGDRSRSAPATLRWISNSEQVILRTSSLKDTSNGTSLDRYCSHARLVRRRWLRVPGKQAPRGDADEMRDDADLDFEGRECPPAARETSAGGKAVSRGRVQNLETAAGGRR